MSFTGVQRYWFVNTYVKRLHTVSSQFVQLLTTNVQNAAFARTPFPSDVSSINLSIAESLLLSCRPCQTSIFPLVQFLQVVQKHYLGEMGNETGIWCQNLFSYIDVKYYLTILA